MPTITIPKNLIAKEKDLIAIPRKEYEMVLRSKNNKHNNIAINRLPSFRDPKKYIVIKIKIHKD